MIEIELIYIKTSRFGLDPLERHDQEHEREFSTSNLVSSIVKKIGNHFRQRKIGPEKVYSHNVYGEWVPMVVRGGKKYLKELSRRIEADAAKYQSGQEARRLVGELEELGDKLFQAQKEANLNPTELSQLTGIDEELLVFATAGLLEPSELTAEFLSKINEALGKDIKIE